MGFVLTIGNTLESLKNALSELEREEAGKGGSKEGEKVRRGERSNIPRRHISVGLR